jgi:hypothetical protein
MSHRDPNWTCAAAIGTGRWRGFETREAAQAWLEANAPADKPTQIVPIALAGTEVVAP